MEAIDTRPRGRAVALVLLSVLVLSKRSEAGFEPAILLVLPLHAPPLLAQERAQSGVLCVCVSIRMIPTIQARLWLCPILFPTMVSTRELA